MHELFTLWWQAPTPSSPITVTLDIAQLVMLGGLIWRLAEMSKTIKDLTAVTAQLTLGARVFSDGLAVLVTRVAVLEDRNSDRRDRRRDDINDSPRA